MTDKELSKLRRTELLEILIAQGKENTALQEQLKQTEKALRNRELTIENTGSVAEVAFRLNDVVGSTQRAVDLYIENVKRVMEQQQPEYVRFPEMEMPVVEVEGNSYVCTLRIPELGLELPVMSDWSYPQLKIAPCRYQGSAYQNDLIIIAHNYASHFGHLKELLPGAEVTVTDMAGNLFCYAVAETEILAPHQVEALENTDYPLTLLTCTLGGRTRVTVRCEKVGDIPAEIQ